MFTLGLNSSTLEMGGLDKHLDMKIRFYDDESTQVEDAYFNSISMWKEPADIQFAAMVKSA